MRGFASIGGVAFVVAVMVAALFVFASIEPATAQDAAPSAREIEQWVRDLGDDNYTVRQVAADRLMAVGFPARAALAEVTDGPDPEVRAAARRLVLLIDRTEFSRRLADFAADVDGKRGITLPGWEKFSELAGRDESARNLFVEMQRAEAPLFDKAFGEQRPDAINLGWEMRILRLRNWQVMNRQAASQAPLGSCATMFFLGTFAESQMTDAASNELFALAQSPPMVEALQPQRGQAALRRLVSAWAVNCPNAQSQIVAGRLALMNMYELSDALPLALGVATGDARYPIMEPAQRIVAIQLVGRFGTAMDATALEPLLADETPYLPPPAADNADHSNYSVQMRDIALATMLHLTGQEPSDYGFMHVRRNPQSVFDARSLGMDSNERRAAAATQWRAWAATQKQADFSLR